MTAMEVVLRDVKDPTLVHMLDLDGRYWRICQEDADPEHRFAAYRVAADYFGNRTQTGS